MRRSIRRRLLVLAQLLLVPPLAAVLVPLWYFEYRASLVRESLVYYFQPPSQVLVPVVGVRPDALSGSFGAPRSEHRLHQGIDIFAPRGTAVVAAATGRVVRIGWDRLGGNVVWMAGAGARLYYYAHLDSYREDLSVGETIRAGGVLGYVGTTGNALHTPPHLHFGIYPLATRFQAIDPYPVLRAHRPRT